MMSLCEKFNVFMSGSLSFVVFCLTDLENTAVGFHLKLQEEWGSTSVLIDWILATL